MFLALREMSRARVRFGLLICAVGLLVFLILTQQAIQGGLITGFVGALRQQSAPVLVYSGEGERTLQGSVIDPRLEAKIRGADCCRRAPTNPVISPPWMACCVRIKKTSSPTAQISRPKRTLALLISRSARNMVEHYLFRSGICAPDRPLVLARRGARRWEPRHMLVVRELPPTGTSGAVLKALRGRTGLMIAVCACQRPDDGWCSCQYPPQLPRLLLLLHRRSSGQVLAADRLARHRDEPALRSS